MLPRNSFINFSFFQLLTRKFPFTSFDSLQSLILLLFLLDCFSHSCVLLLSLIFKLKPKSMSKFRAKLLFPLPVICCSSYLPSTNFIISLVISYFTLLKLLCMKEYFKFLEAVQQMWYLLFENLQKNMGQYHQ